MNIRIYEPFPYTKRTHSKVHPLEHSHGWCATCDDKAEPNSNINIQSKSDQVIFNL